MSKIDLTAKITNLNGAPLASGDGAAVRLCDQLADFVARDDVEKVKDEDLASRLRRFALGQKLATANGPIELNADEKTLIRARLLEYGSTLIIGQTIALIGEK